MLTDAAWAIQHPAVAARSITGAALQAPKAASAALASSSAQPPRRGEDPGNHANRRVAGPRWRIVTASQIFEVEGKSAAALGLRGQQSGPDARGRRNQSGTSNCSLPEGSHRLWLLEPP